ncbi:MAG TPA: YpmS family protein [Pseudogracilibacillus sp.]|nr:YpmS family protein [Pseudogracilibacillus sp.]
MRQTNKRDLWRKRFFILAIINAVVFVGLIFYLYSPVPSKKFDIREKQWETKTGTEFVIRTSKQNLNDLVNAYLDKLLSQTKQNFTVVLDEDVELYGELPVFSTTVPLLIRFDPIVQDNGDIALKQKSISVGQLKLPNKKIMQYVDRFLPTPEWIIIDPKEEEIYIKITEMDIQSNLDVKIEQFDLAKNNIAIRLRVPYETLGIETLKQLEEEE